MFDKIANKNEATAEDQQQQKKVEVLELDDKLNVFTKIEEVYDEIGPLGKSQICYLIILSLNNFTSAMNFLIAVFLLIIPEWECKPGTSSTCSPASDLCSLPRDSWQWSTNHDRTMVSFFDLQCDSNLAFLASSLFFVPGTVVGLAISGYCSDKYGRKKTMIVSLFAALVLTVGQTFSSSFPLFLVFRTLSGVSDVTYMSVHITYRDEFFPSSKRPMCYFLGILFKAGGLLCLAGIFELFSSWRAQNGTISILILLSLATCVFVPESPHWLLTNHSSEAATEVLLKMAKVNKGGGHGLLLADRIKLGKVTMDEASTTESGNIFMLIRNTKLVVMTLKFFYQWFVTSMLYYGFYYSLDALSGSVSVNFMIMGVLELPMAVFTAIMTDKLGRKKTLIANVSLVLVCCALSLISLDFGNGWNLRRIASIVGSKWGVAAMFFIVYLYTNEVMPTTIRSTGLHMCSIFARIGAFIAPYFVKACNNYNDYLLNSLCIVLSILAIGLTWGLPETKDVALKSNIEDADGRIRNANGNDETKI